VIGREAFAAGLIRLAVATRETIDSATIAVYHIAITARNSARVERLYRRCTE
jgi:hypothetical protein